MSSQTIVIGDSSVLITFASIDRLDLLGSVFAVVLVPPEVQREVFAKDLPPNRRLKEILRRERWLRRMELPLEAVAYARRYGELVDQGEAEAIALAKCRKETVLLDDLAARRLAQAEGVDVVGSLGILSHCKRTGILPDVRPTAEAMRHVGRFFSEDLLRSFFRKEGEL